ncbi:syncytin-1-like [Heterodontus francisci]|uniref:syncytin-1-like n=1 Tax=Heterodontus francisci TaxID=7792 RepID=UPI00355B65B1
MPAAITAYIQTKDISSSLMVQPPTSYCLPSRDKSPSEPWSPPRYPAPQKGPLTTGWCTGGASAEFCENWKRPPILGPTRGHSAGWGILSMVTIGGVGGGLAANNRNYLICGLTILGNATLGALEVITEELSELRLFTMQNRYALDYLLARKGGVCAIIKGKCIMGVRDQTANVTKFMNHIRDQLNDLKDPGSWGKWGFGGWTVWIINMAMYLVVGIACIFAGIAILKYVMGRMQAALEQIGAPRILMVRTHEQTTADAELQQEMELQQKINLDDDEEDSRDWCRKSTECGEREGYHRMIRGGNVEVSRKAWHYA